MRSGSSIDAVLLLARVKPSAECIERANALLQDEADWNALYRISLAHGVAPLICRNLSLLEGVPRDIAQRFTASYLRNAADVTRTSGELKKISGALDGGGVENVAIKGPVTADEIFGEAALYPSSDIDLLIRESDVLRAAEIMKEIGYCQECGPEPFSPERYGRLNFFREGAKGVEFHAGLGRNRYFAVPDDFWWEELRERRYEGHVCRALPPERNLLFAGLHLFEHGYAPLKFIVGIAEMLRLYNNDLDWEGLMQNARTFKVHKPFLLSVFLASELLDAPLPCVVAEALAQRPPKERWIFRRIERLVFADVRLSVVMFWLVLLQFDFFEVWLRMAQWIFPSFKELSYRYNLPPGSKKVYLYYALNPLLLLLKRRNG